MRTMTKELLQRKLVRLKTSLENEKERLRKTCNCIPWGSGMRRTRCTPSFRKEDELLEKIRAVELQLSQMSAADDNHTFKDTDR